MNSDDLQQHLRDAGLAKPHAITRLLVKAMYSGTAYDVEDVFVNDQGELILALTKEPTLPDGSNNTPNQNHSKCGHGHGHGHGVSAITLRKEGYTFNGWSD